MEEQVDAILVPIPKKGNLDSCENSFVVKLVARIVQG